MIEAWLLTVAILGTDISDIRFYNPSVQFPTKEPCTLTAADVIKRYTDNQHQAYAACYRAWDYPKTQ